MSTVAQQLIDRRSNLVSQMREVAERAVTENREMTAEEDRQFTALNAEVDKLQERANALIEGEKRAKETEDAFAALNGKPQERQTNDQSKQAEEFRAFARGERGKYFDVPVEPRDILKSGSGANVVPTTMDGTLWQYMIEESSILGAGATILRTASGEAMDIPKATVHSTSSAVTEGNAITESDPTFAKTPLTVAKAGYVVQVSTEMVNDSGLDLLGYLAQSAGRELGNTVGANAVSVLLAGTSSSVTGPTGVNGGFGTQATANGGFDKVIDLFYSVIAPYRNRSSCGWLMADPTAANVRKIKDTAGQYIWQNAPVAGQPDTILGKPVYIDTNVPDVALSAESVIFGDLSSLYVRLAGGFRFERSDDFAFNADLVTFRALVRHGAAHVDPNATKSFVGAGT